MATQSDQPRRAVIYIRVANRQQRGGAAAIDAQRQACLQRAADLGMTTADEYVDYGSGNVFTERSGLQAMLGKLKARGDIEYVIAYDHARLARNTQVYTQIVWAIEEAGARLETAYTSPAEQEFMEHLQTAIADIASRQHGRSMSNRANKGRS